MTNEELKLQNAPCEWEFEEDPEELEYEDPLDWLHKCRAKLSEKYPTIDALFEYYKRYESLSTEDILAKIRQKIAEKEEKRKNALASNVSESE